MNKPNALIVDTNILIDFLEPEKYSEEQFYDFLMRVNGPHTQLILPQQVLVEWDSLKYKRIELYKKKIDDDFQKYEGLVKHIPEPSGQRDLSIEIRNIRKLSLRSYQYTYAIRAKHIDSVISDFAAIVDRSADIDKLVVDFAVKELPPFFLMELKKERKNSSKNEATDAVIFFSIVNFFENNRDKFDKVAFLSSNTKDFSKPNNPSEIHENLEKYFTDLNLNFFNNLNSTMQFLSYEDAESSFQDLVSTIVGSNERRFRYLTDEYFVKCNECQSEVHINSDIVTHKEYYHYLCPKCKHMWNTGDHVLDDIY
ncbi:PIN domain-containing protein [Gracilibacillus xinjiangensis]|uniref:PIN domain-containing protein n=1 Tax=Gracilibacillus xinjiangensis TaxID=1193282 RepID=A0ABV8WUR7_9BACI